MVGSFLLLLVAAVVGLVAWQQHKWRRGCRAGAARIYGEMSAIFAGPHDYRVVSETDFPGLELSGYREVGAFLRERGFERLGSIENLTVTAVHPGQRTLIEVYASADRSFGAVTYRVADRQIVDFGTALENGHFVVTTNADLDKLRPPHMVDRATLSVGTPVEEILAKHLERHAALSERDPNVRFVRAATVEQAIAMSERHSRIVSEYRQSVGLLTEEEMLGFATRPDEEHTARAMWTEFRRLWERDHVSEQRADDEGRAG